MVPCWKRSDANPILTRESIPDVPPRLVDASSVFNPGAVRRGDRILLLLRVQSRGRETFLMPATSEDGEHFTVSPRLCQLTGLEIVKERIYHVYDPRISCIEGSCYLLLAMDVESGCRLGVARTSDFETIELIGVDPEREMRNGVLFPERIGGRYLRLDRPNDLSLASGGRSGSEIWLSTSADLVRWEPVRRVIKGRAHYWDERIGPGPPPLKTRQGWLHLYHGVATHFESANIYQVGALLLDLRDPSKVIARSRNNCLEPREPYELTGQLPNVVFPTGLVIDDVDEQGFASPDGRVRLYYGAADSSVALATATVGEMLAMCED